MGNASACCWPGPIADRKQPGDEEGGEGTNKVELAASMLFTIPGIASAYHTSVLVNGEEFFFSDSGIFSNRALTSHQGEPSELVYMGLSKRTGSQVLNALQTHFRPGSYDLIRKNCNSFSDCALHFLLQRRLPSKYSAMEAIGQRASLEMLQRVTKGAYHPNEAAKDFSAEDVISVVDQLGAEVSSSSSECPKSRPALFLGAQVTIMGLKGAPHLNGQGARIVRYNAVNGRWEAAINFLGEVKAFRAENLRPAGEIVLEAGSRCRIHGLQSESGQALNGREAEVLRYLHGASRYEVLLDGASKSLKAENLQAI